MPDTHPPLGFTLLSIYEAGLNEISSLEAYFPCWTSRSLQLILFWKFLPSSWFLFLWELLVLQPCLCHVCQLAPPPLRVDCNEGEHKTVLYPQLWNQCSQRVGIGIIHVGQWQRPREISQDSGCWDCCGWLGSSLSAARSSKALLDSTKHPRSHSQSGFLSLATLK